VPVFQGNYQPEHQTHQKIYSQEYDHSQYENYYQNNIDQNQNLPLNNQSIANYSQTNQSWQGDGSTHLPSNFNESANVEYNYSAEATPNEIQNQSHTHDAADLNTHYYNQNASQYYYQNAGADNQYHDQSSHSQYYDQGNSNTHYQELDYNQSTLTQPVTVPAMVNDLSTNESQASNQYNQTFIEPQQHIYSNQNLSHNANSFNTSAHASPQKIATPIKQSLQSSASTMISSGGAVIEEDFGFGNGKSIMNPPLADNTEVTSVTCKSFQYLK
jgi:hypothetical protein